MAYYGIPTAASLSAGAANDTVSMGGNRATTITGASVYGGDGNDLISFAAVGATGIFTSRTTAAAASGEEVSGTISGVLTGPGAQYSGSTSFSGATTTSGTITFSGVITSQAAARIINGAYFQANAGNDTIAFGDQLTTVSASTFAGGAGNDRILAANNINNDWGGSASLSGAAFNKVGIEGGKGNDSISLNGDNTIKSINVNSNVGNDDVSFISASISGASVIGLGQGNDIFSGTLESISTSTIAGGKGNDTINLSASTTLQLVVGGDRANANMIDGDGNDSIYIAGGSVISATVYGGGGNDSLTWSGDLGSGNTISLGAGKDVFTGKAATIIDNSTLGFGAGNDAVYFEKSGSIQGSRINLAKGNDSVFMNSTDVGSGTMLSGTTIYGGAGKDLLLKNASAVDGGTVKAQLLYATASESTVSAYDTVAVDFAKSGSFDFRYEPGSLTGGTFTASDATGTNGMVVFTSTFATTMTARAAVVATNTSVGEAAAFVDGAGLSYLFVKGTSENLVVQVGSAAISGATVGGSITLNAAKNQITLNLG
jgi:Ca2+-binding RTX toxin-like protein